jgi:hypothetical protein
MRNKVQVSSPFKKEFLLVTLAVTLFLPFTIQAQGKPADSSNTRTAVKKAELKVRQQGSNWQFAFPRIQFRSALKVTNSNGALVKAVMVDEGLEAINVSLNNLPKGIYQCVLENRTQRFAARVMVR